MANKKITLLATIIAITKTDEITVKQTIRNKNINDFEDGFEYYSALDSGCKIIITEYAGNFYSSEIEVIDCNGFLNKYP